MTPEVHDIHNELKAATNCSDLVPFQSSRILKPQTLDNDETQLKNIFPLKISD